MHCARKVFDDTYWVGVDDRRISLFENIHPVPYGVSYNSFLIASEKTALIDTVDWSACRQMMENVLHVLDGRDLDYLVVDHMEPDHAGSVEEVLRRWPNAAIAATAKAFEMMEQFGVSIAGHEAIKAADGASIDVGDHKLVFSAAPMVHWPEVMVTFDTKSGALYSADAFGTFVTLDGRVFSDEVDFEGEMLDEARRYYTNIVGKYGGPVQLLLKKASPILGDVKYICSLHGPIWRGDCRSRIIELTDKWSRCVPEAAGVLIVYASMYGGTESAASALASRICERGTTKVHVRDVSKTHTSYLISEAFKYSHIVIASSTYNGELFPLMTALLDDMAMLALKDRTFAIVENGSWASTAGAKIRKRIEGMSGMTILEPAVTIKSAASGERDDEQITALADAIAASVREKSEQLKG